MFRRPILSQLYRATTCRPTNFTTIARVYCPLLNITSGGTVKCMLLFSLIAPGHAGYPVYKMLNYGPVEECVAFLSRRAQENSSAISTACEERKLISGELRRRFNGLFAAGSPWAATIEWEPRAVIYVNNAKRFDPMDWRDPPRHPKNALLPGLGWGLPLKPTVKGSKKVHLFMGMAPRLKTIKCSHAVPWIWND